MEKILTIDKKDIGFKASAAMCLLYKTATNGGEFFEDYAKLGEMFYTDKNGEIQFIPKATTTHLETMFAICWALAKAYDKTIPIPFDWINQFEEFPVLEIIPELTELIEKSIVGQIDPKNYMAAAVKAKAEVLQPKTL